MKIRHKKLLILTLLCWNVFSADSVTMGVTGNIVASPCIFNGGNSNLDVNLGDIQATNMATPGSSSDYYLNSGTATNVAVAMSEAGSGVLKGTGSSITHNIAADRTATLAMQASVKSVSGGATPGSVSAVVVMTLQYN